MYVDEFRVLSHFARQQGILTRYVPLNGMGVTSRVVVYSWRLPRGGIATAPAPLGSDARVLTRIDQCSKCRCQLVIFVLRLRQDLPPQR